MYVETRLKGIWLERGERRILRDIDWTVRPGERWILAGANGSGKTQLLKLLAGAVWPMPGRGSLQYRWRGEIWRTPQGVLEEIAYMGPERQDKYERYGWNHTVTQIVGTGVHRTDIPLDPLDARALGTIARLLERLSITHLAARRFLTLSYGERRLVLLARALASRPKLLLLDELLNGLDTANAASALRWLDASARSRLPWVLAAHRARDVPRSATHALILENGRVAWSGRIERAPFSRWLGVARTSHAREVGHLRGPTRARSASQRTHRSHGPGGRKGRTSAPRATAPRRLVRLARASVYLDETRVLEGISMDVRPGDCWVVHGANGSGKSTLLRALYGDLGVALGGSIERDGIVPGVPISEFKLRAGFIAPQLQTEYPRELSVLDVVASGLHASIGLNEPARARERAAALRSLEFFGLGSLAGRKLATLSYGQARRVLFARAMVRRPELLLLDEPFAGLDAPTRRALLARIDVLVGQGVAVVIATHHAEEWPGSASHELELAGGHAVHAGTLRAERAG